MIRLNKKQKQFLFDNCYVTPKALDALTTEGWQDYFIKSYDWALDGKDRYGFEKLYLKDRDDGSVSFRLGLNFQDDDYSKLMSLKGGR